MIIIVRRAQREKLLESFGTSKSFLSEALRFKQNSVMARKVRHTAMNVHSGVIVTL